MTGRLLVKPLKGTSGTSHECQKTECVINLPGPILCFLHHTHTHTHTNLPAEDSCESQGCAFLSFELEECSWKSIVFCRNWLGTVAVSKACRFLQCLLFICMETTTDTKSTMALLNRANSQLQNTAFQHSAPLAMHFQRPRT